MSASWLSRTLIFAGLVACLGSHAQIAAAADSVAPLAKDTSSHPRGQLSPDLSAALDACRTYVVTQADEFVRRTRAFVDAVKTGRLAEAKSLYAYARQPYERIEPVAALFGDIVKRMDVRADEFELRERDPAFIGFHRLEMSLFAEGTTAGLAEIAERLASDSTELQQRILATPISPTRMVGGASALIESIAATKISGEEERYSRTDLWDFQGNIEGSKAIFVLLRPLLEQDQEFVARVDRNYRRVEDVLSRYRAAGDFAPYDRLTSRDRNALKGPITLLAEDLSTLRARLNLD
ncbi:iron uptake system protein EfeO [Methylobacterium gnaphalii]|uniref:Imelysin-like domain-containing protein n=1 Tax=Methylobacterium gnaphalii TaxID=1010610 RepID=A0A512JQA9_9HYPH|nr:iron uptake system protein EfeO [Methylobacterium gnaphalii]GEP12150.1 hypothetical protein MGN01_39950 [Methylobacterium gnaphalii]GJD70014.1 Iron uptake system component EfeO [Methylobacterium gnaphalii]GLS48909.1 hypothetical protein GCM10007885_17560 [Methylobacterium gnaphalii]